jgi:hypothetical protein
MDGQTHVTFDSVIQWTYSFVGISFSINIDVVRGRMD